MKHLGFLFFMLLCSGCASYPVYERALSRDEIKADRKIKIPLTVAVAAAPAEQFRNYSDESDENVHSDMWKAISNLVHDLKKTGLFRNVFVLNPTNHADLIAESRIASGCAKCGTPFIMQKMTLGILSAETSYWRSYDFRFISPKNGKQIQFHREYEGIEYAPSVLFVPFVIWQPRTTEIDLLRHDLLARSREILDLANPPISCSMPSDR